MRRALLDDYLTTELLSLGDYRRDVYRLGKSSTKVQVVGRVGRSLRRIFTFLLAVYIVLGETVIITFFGKRTLNRFNY
jgi:hypothetical protein